jgi:hypothetical protein
LNIGREIIDGRIFGWSWSLLRKRARKCGKSFRIVSITKRNKRFQAGWKEGCSYPVFKFATFFIIHDHFSSVKAYFPNRLQ